MKKIITYGTFDSFHNGHKNLIDRCKKMGDEIYIGVASDKYVKNKGKNPIFNQYERMERMKLIPGVKEVFLEEGLEQWEDDYSKYGINLIVMGSDHIGELDYMITEKKLNLTYLSRTKGVSTTEVKHDLSGSKVGLVYLDSNKDKWENLINSSLNECNVTIISLIGQHFNQEELYNEICYIEEKYKPYIVYIGDLNSKENDLIRFNVYKFYE